MERLMAPQIMLSQKSKERVGDDLMAPATFWLPPRAVSTLMFSLAVVVLWSDIVILSLLGEVEPSRLRLVTVDDIGVAAAVVLVTTTALLVADSICCTPLPCFVGLEESDDSKSSSSVFGINVVVESCLRRLREYEKLTFWSLATSCTD